MEREGKVEGEKGEREKQGMRERAMDLSGEGDEDVGRGERWCGAEKGPPCCSSLKAPFRFSTLDRGARPSTLCSQL